MITIFRKIRRTLIESNSTRKYLIYAIGEIALVVIGILIALQVNNWNETRKANKEVEIIKKNLADEFIQNRKVLDDRIGLLDQSIEYSNTIVGFMGNPPQDLRQEEIDSILVYTLYYGNFNPSNSSIQELIQSGGLKLLSDDSLKTLLFDWLQMLEDTDEDFKNQDLNAAQYLTPYLYKHVSMRNLDMTGNYRITNSPSLLISGYYEDLFNDYEFENLMVNHIVWHTIMLKHYRELDDLAERILATLKM